MICKLTSISNNLIERNTRIFYVYYTCNIMFYLFITQEKN